MNESNPPSHTFIIIRDHWHSNKFQNKPPGFLTTLGFYYASQPNNTEWLRKPDGSPSTLAQDLYWSDNETEIKWIFGTQNIAVEFI